MLKKITALMLLSTPLSTAHFQNHITLVTLQAKPPAIIGHTHVFSDAGQTLHFTFPTSEKVKAQLYRTANNILTPAGKPILIAPQKNHPTPISIDFPPSEKPLQYTLIFNTKNKTRLDITALSKNHLSPLIKATRDKQITLINPPEGLVDNLRQLDIPSRIQNSPSHSKEEMLIFFKKNGQLTPKTQAKRLIIVEPASDTNNEIWIQLKKGSWKVIVPSFYFAPSSLLTASGQVRLKKILLDTPDSY